jgi:hypothetical protein
LKVTFLRNGKRPVPWSAPAPGLHEDPVLLKSDLESGRDWQTRSHDDRKRLALNPEETDHTTTLAEQRLLLPEPALGPCVESSPVDPNMLEKLHRTLAVIIEYGKSVKAMQEAILFGQRRLTAPPIVTNLPVAKGQKRGGRQLL